MIAMVKEPSMPQREELIAAMDAVREYGIPYGTLRYHWTVGAAGIKLQSWRERGRIILLLRSEVVALVERLKQHKPNV